jgi:hypothetical protein
MSHWKNPNMNLGVIKAGTPKKVVFYGLATLPKITAITPYCGCTTANFDEKKKELVITYNNSNIPPQVQRPQSISKRVDITYDTGMTDVLTIKATRVR